MDGGGGGSVWRYGKQTGGSSLYTIGNGSSSSGTIVSTAYTSTGSHRLSSIAEEAMARHLELDLELEKMDKDKKVKRISSLVKEFFGEPEPSVKCSSSSSKGGGNMSVVIQDAMLKMLTFADGIASEVVSDDVGLPAVSYSYSYMKLSAMLGVHGALSNALSELQQLLYPPPSEEVSRVESEVVGLLSAKKGKASEAIWSTMEDYWSRILDLQHDGDDDDRNSSSGTPTTPRGSSDFSHFLDIYCKAIYMADIHKANRFMKSYIMLLRANYSSADAVVFEAATLGKYVPLIPDISPLDSMIVEMTHGLQDKLVSISKYFPDQGLRFLFLLNNAYFMLEHLHRQDFRIHRSGVMDLDYKVKAYMKSYLQVSWVPVVSCLFDPTLVRLFGKSPLLKFESEFQKTYTTQKHWKVPDPELRNGLRTAITERIIPGYTKYIADNNIATARFTPQELEEMLQELFEG